MRLRLRLDREGEDPYVPQFHFAAWGFLVLTTIAIAHAFRPEIPRIPKAWDDREVARFEVPLAQADRSRYLNAAECYALEIAPMYRAYPVYAPGSGPAVYLETLK